MREGSAARISRRPLEMRQTPRKYVLMRNIKRSGHRNLCQRKSRGKVRPCANRGEAPRPLLLVCYFKPGDRRLRAAMNHNTEHSPHWTRRPAAAELQKAAGQQLGRADQGFLFDRDGCGVLGDMFTGHKKTRSAMIVR